MSSAPEPSYFWPAAAASRRVWSMIFHDRSIATSSLSASGPTGMPAKRAQFSIIGAGTPSLSMRWPSLMKVPQTRDW